MKSKIILIPGNGGSSVEDNWFPQLKEKLEAEGVNVVAEEFPDRELARAEYWLPFLTDKLRVDENTILVGHSSGAIAAMRLAEVHKLAGIVLVGAYYTDLGMETEKQSGYFNLPWNWERIKENAKWISLFASQDDPWIPIAEPRYIHSQLNCEYHEYKSEGHFGGDPNKIDFPELALEVLKNFEY